MNKKQILPLFLIPFFGLMVMSTMPVVQAVTGQYIYIGVECTGSTVPVKASLSYAGTGVGVNCPPNNGVYYVYKYIWVTTKSPFSVVVRVGGQTFKASGQFGTHSYEFTNTYYGKSDSNWGWFEIYNCYYGC